MQRLREYFKKRSFSSTPEPRTSSKKPHEKELVFVVQQHHASRMHWDFRLEMEGVLKSWAVPKGPSMNPHDHHLAIQTEDHPYDYRNFEGVIPKGNYGAGNVIIWDAGTYEPRDPAGSEKTLLADLKKGHLTFTLHGQKLKGEFALIKMPDAKEDDAWLLIKKGDEFASTDDVLQQYESIKSHRGVDELGGKPTLPDLEAYPHAAKPWTVKPMLCTLVDDPFDKDDWLFEVKWDGYRAIASKHKDEIQLYSRNETDFREAYPPVMEALRELKHDVILDGEIVVVDDHGTPHFEALQQWRHTGTGNLQYYVFDILWCDGRDVRTMPLIERKKILKSILPASDILRYSDHLERNGVSLFKTMQHKHLEGMVAKNAQSTYDEGVRGYNWLKIKTHMRQEVVIGGYTEPRGSRQYLGALIVGVYEDGELQYAGHSGGGIPDTARKSLWQKLQKLERKTSPFAEEPKPNAPVHWVRPELVCEMSFSEWTKEGSMRHPQFKGMRLDKKAREVHREKPKSRAQSVAKTKKTPASGQLELTHLDKIFFPKHGYTKADIIHYYESMADYILPYLKDRACSLNRMPDGIKGESFYQKNNPHLPDWVPHAEIWSDSNNANLKWVVGNSLAALKYMVQLGCIEINPWNSRVQHLEQPDWVVIDIDPDGNPFTQVVEVALVVKQVCDEWRVPVYPKTSGKTGIHLYIPLAAKYEYEQAKNFAHLIVLEVNRRLPKFTSVERMPVKRKGKIYLDFLQNREGQTLAAPYSLRPTPDAAVSTPLHWDEVTPRLKPTDFTIKNTLTRVKREGDLWKPVIGKGIDLAKTIKAIETS